MKICVIGTGTMAKGIVKAFAAKMPVVMKSRTQESLDNTLSHCTCSNNTNFHNLILFIDC